MKYDSKSSCHHSHSPDVFEHMQSKLLTNHGEKDLHSANDPIKENIQFKT